MNTQFRNLKLFKRTIGAFVDNYAPDSKLSSVNDQDNFQRFRINPFFIIGNKSSSLNPRSTTMSMGPLLNLIISVVTFARKIALHELFLRSVQKPAT